MHQHTILSAGPDDVPALNQLVNSAYRGDSSRQGWTTEADLLGGIRTDEQGLRDMIEHPDATILLYKIEDQLVGCVYLEVKGDSLYLGLLTVSPELQAGGIGRALLARAELYAREHGCRLITMTVLSQRHELIAWYKRRGYHQTGDTRPFPSDDPRFGLPKVPLSFIVLEKEV
ncbi:GNAT family N-acetyltransferase [Fibrella sp. WM1]|uniref:GNAT family N-acetyltransferase n=1 Tax=Fibrella musci TaxID=3242485 RepID=UPI003520E61A